MRYFVEKSEFDFSLETKTFCKDISDIENEEIDFLSSLIPDALSEFEVMPLGSFSGEEAEDVVYTAAEKYLHKIASSLFLHSREVDENGIIVTRINIPILDLALSYLENERCDYFSCARVGAYVEACLLDFAEKSVWHVGACSKDGKLADIKQLRTAEANYEKSKIETRGADCNKPVPFVLQLMMWSFAFFVIRASFIQ